jgi:hypothetical protein
VSVRAGCADGAPHFQVLERDASLDELVRAAVKVVLGHGLEVLEELIAEDCAAAVSGVRLCTERPGGLSGSCFACLIAVRLRVLMLTPWS